MPAAIAARLPRLHEKRSACSAGCRRAALRISRQVPSVEPSSTAYTLSSSRRVVDGEGGVDGRPDAGLLVHGRHHDGDARQLARSPCEGR